LTKKKLARRGRTWVARSGDKGSLAENVHQKWELKEDGLSNRNNHNPFKNREKGIEKKIGGDSWGKGFF